MKTIVNKVMILFLMLFLALSVFIMCGPTHGNGGSGDGGSGGGSAVQYTLTIEKKGNGSTTPVPGEHTYDQGVSVNISTATESGWHFAKWEGDVGDNTTSTPISVKMDKDKTVTAVFESHLTLTVNTVGGRVTMSPNSSDGLPVGAYVVGEQVTLSVEEVENLTQFSGWSGDHTGTEKQITITMDTDKEVTATFSSPDTVIEKREMVPVTGETYTQESTEGESFSNTISDFSIGKYEVTYELWHAVYEWATDKGYRFQNAGREGDDGEHGADPTDESKYHPVTTVNWGDCIVWCNAYSEIMGLKPAYKSGGTVLKDSREGNFGNWRDASCDWFASGYRLPTEGEWQFAASNRGDTDCSYASGATADYTDAEACKQVAWYSANSGSHTHPVGEKNANGLGLYDMSGNVYEWCWDWSAAYPSGSVTDYRGASSGDSRVQRSGSWGTLNTNVLQVGFRTNLGPHYGDEYMGFRLVQRSSSSL